jgi:hypothetical protein
MLEVPRDATAAQITRACRIWLEVYGREDFQVLAAMLYQPPHLSGAWTPALLKSIVPTNYPPEPVLKVRLGALHLGDAVVVTPVTPDWARYADGVRALVEFSLPLEGGWSDLTVQFELYVVNDGWAFHLVEIHVL